MKATNNKEVKLYFGCGKDYKEGWVNVDYYAEKTDLKHDMNVFPYPFKDDYAGEILFIRSIEYIHDLTALFKELWRIARNNAIIRIYTQHFSNFQAFGDITYAHNGFATKAFHTLDKSYVRDSMFKEDFRILKTRILFKRHAKYLNILFNDVINTNITERWISKWLPFEEVYVEIKVVK